MEHQKRIAILLALCGVIILAFALIYPTTPGQRLYDSTNYHYMASLVSRDGTAHWNLGLLSLFELSPISAGTMGQVYFLSGLSQITGIHIQPAIYLMNLGWMILLCLSSFLLGRKIFNNNIVGLLTSFFFMSGRVILSYNRWTATPRGFATAILPFIFLLMISSYEYNCRKIFRKKIFLFFIFLIILTPAIHRLIYLFFPVIISYFIYIKFYPIIDRKTSRIFTKNRMIHKIKANLSGILLYSAIIGITIFFSINHAKMFFGRTQFLSESAILQGEKFLIYITNYFYLMSRSFGIAAIFSIVGFLSLAGSRKTSLELFLIIGLLAFLPFSIRDTYILPIWILFFSLFAAIGFKKISSHLLKKDVKINMIMALIVVLLLIPILVPPFVTIVEPYKPERVRLQHVTNIEMETGNYLKYYLKDNQTFYADPHFNSHIFTGLSGREGLGLLGVEFATVNETMRQRLETEPLIEFRGIGSTLEFLEEFHAEKGVMYKLKSDPLFTGERFYLSRHLILFKRDFMTENYYMIIDAYNIETIIIDNHFVLDHIYIDSLETHGYLTYSNSRYSFYHAP